MKIYERGNITIMNPNCIKRLRRKGKRNFTYLNSEKGEVMVITLGISANEGSRINRTLQNYFSYQMSGSGFNCE